MVLYQKKVKVEKLGGHDVLITVEKLGDEKYVFINNGIHILGVDAKDIVEALMECDDE